MRRKSDLLWQLRQLAAEIKYAAKESASIQCDQISDHDRKNTLIETLRIAERMLERIDTTLLSIPDED